VNLKFQLDEDCQAYALAAALQQHGIDVKTTNQLKLSGVSDEAQLDAAFQNQRVLVTNNIRDFVPLHRRSLNQQRAHAGIIVFPQQDFSIGEAVRRLARISYALSMDEMRNRLEWLNDWGATPQ
jgi:hypothetical protein